jgi:hypothetical protein
VEFVVVDLLGPTSLAARKDPRGLEVLQILVVDKNLEGSVEGLEVMSPQLDSCYNR